MSGEDLRKIDALIVKHVFGLSLCETPGCDGKDHLRTDAWTERDGSIVITSSPISTSGWFKPSEDIADAWKVVEKMTADGWDYQLQRVAYGQHQIQFWRIKANEPTAWGNGDADTAPLAIALAALAAKNVSLPAGVGR